MYINIVRWGNAEKKLSKGIRTIYRQNNTPYTPIEERHKTTTHTALDRDRLDTPNGFDNDLLPILKTKNDIEYGQ